MEELIKKLKAIEALDDVASEVWNDRAFVKDARVDNDELEVMLCELLCGKDGSLDHQAVIELESHGFTHKVFEQDSFGPLMCGVNTVHGWFTYG